MSILNFGSGKKSSGFDKEKSVKAILGIALVAITVALGSTLAANININSGPVEFGQGVAQTTACDSAITITPNSSFDNSATPIPAPTPTTATGVFVLGSITVSGVDSGDGTGCDGKYLTLKGYGESSNTPLDLIDGTSSFTIYVNYGSDFTTPQSGFTVETIDSSSFTITFTSPTQSSSALYKLTIESSDTSPNPTASPSSSSSSSPSSSASAYWAVATLPAFTNSDWVNQPTYALSSDGTKIVAALGDALWRSIDSGYSWSDITPSTALDVSTHPFSAAWSSPDGNNLATVQFKGDLYISSNAGASWTSSGIEEASISLSLSSDMQKIFIGTREHWTGSAWAAGGTVLRSVDGGANWTSAASFFLNTEVRSVKTTLDGSKVWALGEFDFWQSQDGGMTWSLNSHGGTNWGSCCWVADSSDDLNTILIGANGNGFYLSKDGGDTFTQWNPDPVYYGYGLGVSRDGTKLVALNLGATEPGNLVWVSQDGGTVWVQQTLSQDTWHGLAAISNSGNTIVLGTEIDIDWFATHSGSTYIYHGVN
ncbi:MAG: hypothetical protein NT152_02345 [Actinobacteria bacterium]|nr:hypothetical protein [Actinomycetota bacterium]